MDIEGALEELEVYIELLDVDGERTRHVKKDVLDLEGITNEVESHLAKLKDKFHQLSDDDSEAVVKFTAGAYMSYLDAEFVATQPEGGTIYSPDKLIDSVRMLTLEFAHIGQIGEFYGILEKGLKNSKRFMYKLMVEDLPSILSNAKTNEKYKDVFGYFAVEIAREAAYLTESGCKDKGNAFREKHRELIEKHFPYLNSNQKEEVKSATSALDVDILESYAAKGVVDGVRAFQKDYGKVGSVKWSSQHDGHNRQISFTLDPGNGHNSQYKSIAHLEGIKLRPDVKDFLIGVIDVAAQNLRKAGQTGSELTDTIACLRYAKRHL